MKFTYLKKFLFPLICLLCHQYSHRHQSLCLNCLNDLPTLKNACLRCARSLPSSLASLCGSCLTKPPPFDTTTALFAYQPPVTHLIVRLKFAHALVNANLLGELLFEKISSSQQPLPDLIIPMPLHRERLKERGFNQSIEIAKPLSKKLQIPLDVSHCFRIKHTQAQAKLSAQTRQQNIKNAFEIKKDFSGKVIAVVDDVITTGATIHEFCRLLKTAGAKRIDVWCCARA